MSRTVEEIKKAREWKDFLKTTESPCPSCPNREIEKCNFYGVTLETFPGLGYIPCEQCQEDCESEEDK